MLAQLGMALALARPAHDNETKGPQDNIEWILVMMGHEVGQKQLAQSSKCRWGPL